MVDFGKERTPRKDVEQHDKDYYLCCGTSASLQLLQLSHAALPGAKRVLKKEGRAFFKKLAQHNERRVRARVNGEDGRGGYQDEGPSGPQNYLQIALLRRE